MMEENKKGHASILASNGLQAKHHGAGPKVLPKGGVTPPAVHRRALSEVGNLVEHATHIQRREEGIAVLAHVSTKRAQQKKTGSFQDENLNNGMTHRKEAGAEYPTWGSKRSRTGKFLPSLAAEAAPTATFQQQQQQQQHASKLPTARCPSSCIASNAAGEDVFVQRLVLPQAHQRAAHAPAAGLHGNCTITSSLARREEACGEADMEAESLLDIDWGDRENPKHVTQYVEDIYAFYRRAEKQSLVSSMYMSRQMDLSDKMRAILIDWLIDVHQELKLVPETLYLTVNLIDRYLETNQVKRKNLQLVGSAAMLLASKYEDVEPAEAETLAYLTEDTYSRQKILRCEMHMLESLGFNLTVPTPYVFAARFMKAAAAVNSGSPEAGFQVNKATFDTTWYLLELCLPDYGMLKFPPSLLAAAALYTALLRDQQEADESSASGSPLFERSWSSTSSGGSVEKGVARGLPIWTPLLERHSGYTEGQLMSCVQAMVALHQEAPTGDLQAVHNKYSQARFSEVAKLRPARMPKLPLPASPVPSLSDSGFPTASGATDPAAFFPSAGSGTGREEKQGPCAREAGASAAAGGGREGREGDVECTPRMQHLPVVAPKQQAALRSLPLRGRKPPSRYTPGEGEVRKDRKRKRGKR